MNLNKNVEKIIKSSIKAVLPDAAVKKALAHLPEYTGNLYMVAIGKASWQMASAAHKVVGDSLKKGVVITKYKHSKGNIPNVSIYEAGHPVPDENSYRATEKAMEMVANLKKEDIVLFLISGGGSASFEKPLISHDEMECITEQLLGSGADIVEINTVRKRLSAVKGGRFAELCAPARVFSIVLSDIIGSPLDMIASGPAYPDSSSSLDSLNIAEKYHLSLSEEALDLLHKETPKFLDNVETHVSGSVQQLCQAAAGEAKLLGYQTIILTESMCCEAKEAGYFMSSIAIKNKDSTEPIAFIAGGETVVHMTGKGKGGRNQELVLAAARGIAGIENVVLFSFGSDGTDGPTDAAGGFVDGKTIEKLNNLGINVVDALKNNDSYNTLKAVDGLIFTGPTGTNVNDLTVLLIN